MGAATEKKAKQAATAGPFPVAVLAGTDQFLRRDTLGRLCRAFLGAPTGSPGFLSIDPRTPLATILDECRTGSMFSPRKLIYVEPADNLLRSAAAADGDADNADDDSDDGVESTDPGAMDRREVLERYVGNPAPDSLLVLAFNSWKKNTRLHKQLDAHKAVYPCEAAKPAAVPHFIAQRARDAYQKRIDPQAALLLAELVGTDLARVDNELAKLALYEPANPVITRQAVAALVGFQAEREIWDLVAALAAQDLPLALQKIQELYAMDTKIQYSGFGAVFFFLGTVLKARDALDRGTPEGQVARTIWPQERASSVLTLAKRWGPGKAAALTAAMLAADMANKTSVGEPQSNMEKFAVAFCTA